MKKRSELSLQELTRINLVLKGALIAFGTIGLIAVVVLYFLEAYTVLFIPIMMFPIIALPMVISLKLITEEMSTRNSKSHVEL